MDGGGEIERSLYIKASNHVGTVDELLERINRDRPSLDLKVDDRCHDNVRFARPGYAILGRVWSDETEERHIVAIFVPEGYELVMAIRLTRDFYHIVFVPYTLEELAEKVTGVQFLPALARRRHA